MRLIDADAFPFESEASVINGNAIIVGKRHGKTLSQLEFVLKKMLDNAPTVDAEPVRHGAWKYEGFEGDVSWQTDGRGDCWRVFRCSECGVKKCGGTATNYCPNCGAKMDG